MDEIAKIYIKWRQEVYRIKIFENTIGVERKAPNYASNILLPRTGWNRRLYDEEIGAWDTDEFDEIIGQYEIALMQLDKG